ncbi:dihydrolipoyllysine-residue acetyltransferase [Trifolium repens]|nr:dihydrolipoyllysine-residue acetyltransferase [Trifolium repens]
MESCERGRRGSGLAVQRRGDSSAMVLHIHPVINSSRRDGNSFTYNSSINIAVVVAIDGRLITPVLQDADKVDVYSLSRK